MAIDFRGHGVDITALDRWGREANLRVYGGVGDGVTADDDALDAAYAALPEYGGTILFPQGRWLFMRDHAFLKPIVLLGSGPRHGEQWSTASDERGSFIIIGADIAGALFRWTTSALGNVVRGSGIRQLSVLGAYRAYSVDAALHVESADQFVMRDVDIEHVKGRALRVTRCVKGQFDCSDIFNCGDTGKPSVDLDPTGAGLVQGCVFSGYKIEVSHGADYFSANSNVYNCKFFGFGFEDSELDTETAQTFASVGGVRNQVEGWHFNRQGIASPTAKLILSGTHCQLDNLMVAGHTSAVAGSILVSGNYNEIGAITGDGGTSGQPESTTDFMTVTGIGNHIGSVTGLRLGRVVISGNYNQLDSLSSTTAAMQSLLVSGQYCVVGDAMVAFSTYTGTPVEISGAYSRARVRVLQCTGVTTEAVLVSGASAQLLPGSHVRNSPLAHGCRVTAAGGEICGSFETVGKHGVFIDGGDPRLIDVRVIQFGAVAASTYDGVSMQSSTSKNTGGILRAFVAEAGGNTARNSVFVTDNAGTPRYNNWIMDIVSPGLSTSVSAGNNQIRKVAA